MLWHLRTVLGVAMMMLFVVNTTYRIGIQLGQYLADGPLMELSGNILQNRMQPACKPHFAEALPGGGWTTSTKFKTLYFYHGKSIL